jgi:hypothetical protein
VAETDSAANQFGAPENVEDPRGIFPLFVARVCPSRICRILWMKGDAAETGLQNGNGQIKSPEVPSPGEATLAGRWSEQLHFGGFVPSASANGHHAENPPGKNSTDVMEPADRHSISGSTR